MEYSGKENMTVKSASPHPVKGFIMIRSIDPNGRPVSFVFTGSTSDSDGKDVFLDIAKLKKSVNAKSWQRATHSLVSTPVFRQTSGTTSGIPLCQQGRPARASGRTTRR